MTVIPCEQNAELRRLIEEYAETLKVEAHQLDHGQIFPPLPNIPGVFVFLGAQNGDGRPAEF